MIDIKTINGKKPNAEIEEFWPGDTVIVNLRIIEGDRERTQAFQGNVISGSHDPNKIPQAGDTFTVRRVSYGIGVERVVPFWSPRLESVKVQRYGKVKRAKLYYLRGRTGKLARIKERRR